MKRCDRKWIQRLGTVAAVMTAGVLVATGAEGYPPFEVSHYTRPGDNCGNRLVDPNNVVFYGRHGYPSHAAKLIRKYGDGWTNTEGSTQSVWTHGECRAMTGQRADDCAICNRHHMRFFLNKGRVGIKYYTAADAHTDILTCSRNSPPLSCSPCHKNDTPYGSDHGRAVVANALHYAVPRFGYRFWGNTGKIQQCDGQVAHGDGYVLYLGTG
jgi:hypothetical protein